MIDQNLISTGSPLVGGGLLGFVTGFAIKKIMKLAFITIGLLSLFLGFLGISTGFQLDSSLTDVTLTITHLLEKNLVTTYDAEKILWALLGSVYLYEVEEGKRSKYEIVDMFEAQRELLLKEFSRIEGVGDDKEEQRTGNKCGGYVDQFWMRSG